MYAVTDSAPPDDHSGDGPQRPRVSGGRLHLTRRFAEDSAAISGRWADELNEQQLAAVTAPAGEVLILAGAGSGKTRVITYRVAFLIQERGIKPWQILLATFTNKAARNMLARVEELVGPLAREVTGGTFHHIANLLLRRHGGALGYESSFSILDESDSRSVMKLCRAEAGVERGDKAFPSDRLLCDISSALVNTSTDLETLITRRFPHLMEQYEPIQKVLTDYVLRKKASNQMDFDDLLVNLYRLLRDDSAECRLVQAELAERHRHILVDEYQDVNHLQAEIVARLYEGAAAGYGTRDTGHGTEAPGLGTRDTGHGPEGPGLGTRDTGYGTEAPGYGTRDTGHRIKSLSSVPTTFTESDDVPPIEWGEDNSLSPGPESREPYPASSVPVTVDREPHPASSPSHESRTPYPGSGPEGPRSGESRSDDRRSDKTSRGLFVVGDDAQSIYSFRGADYSNIRGFPDRFREANVYKLEINYRSTPEILRLANAVLSEADPLFRKTLSPVRTSNGEKPLLLACRDADEQAEFVSTQVLRLREDSGLDWKDMAVLYRAHNNRLEVELNFTRRRIPFVVRGGLRFFEQAHIKDLLSYAIVLTNSRDELAWQRMLGMCQRVGPKTIAEVLSKLRHRESAPDPYGGPLGRFCLNGVADSLRGQGKASLTELRDYLRQLRNVSGVDTPEAQRIPPSDLLRRIFDERYKDYLEVQYENWRQREDDLLQLITYAQRFDTLPGFLSEVGLASGVNDTAHNSVSEAEREEGAVTLSTIHQAKGLEWNVVFLIQCQDDVIPHRLALADPDGEDEERRLFYVAVTRAEEQLFMSFPQMTESNDYSGYGLRRFVTRPSRFVSGVDKNLYEEAVLEWD